MGALGGFLKACGLLMLLGPLAAFIGSGVYVYLTNPADQAGWGAIVGGLMILTIAAVPAGLLLLLLGYALGGPKESPRGRRWFP